MKSCKTPLVYMKYKKTEIMEREQVRKIELSLMNPGAKTYFRKVLLSFHVNPLLVSSGGAI